jgi:hypothetical protein
MKKLIAEILYYLASQRRWKTIQNQIVNEI